jgi:hypothetical protein
VERNAKAHCACLTALVAAAAPSLAVGETRWDRKACEYFTHVRDAHICTLRAIESFSPLVNEPAQLIAEQAVKKCAWAWQYVYDHDYPYGPPIIKNNYGSSVQQYMKSWAAEFALPLVLESRLPVGNPQPETNVERDTIRIYTDKLLKDCGVIK